ncbi:MAG: phosphohydrolase [Magnetococcales bacterium]|nr:phosphohydrolase [Magnetococcales bacterium]
MADKTRNGSWIQTYSGLQFWPMDARKHEVNIEDIAHALSMLCRFNGHLERFYSVAEHSVYVSQIVSPENQLWGLIHDSAEAYLADIPSPVKKHLAQFKSIEKNLLKVICSHFNIDSKMPEEIKLADMVLLSTEKKVLMKPEPASWGDMPQPTDKIVIAGLAPHEAKDLFLKRYQEILAQ